MKLVCSQSELNSALQLVTRAVASRPTHPVLANVLMTADAGTGKISVTGFDLSLGIQTSFSASIENSGAITLPAKLLGEIVSKLSSDSPITLFTDSDSAQIDLTSKSGNYQMRGMSADDFPDLPLVESGLSFKLKPNSLLQALRSTLFASSSDDAKQLLTGVHIAFDGENLKAAATDGHRLAVLNIENALINSQDESTGIPDSFSVTLPSRSLREVEKLISTWKDDDLISLFCDRGQVIFVASNQIVTSRTLEGTYPNYNQLIPESFSKSITIDRRPFIEALDRVAVLADQYNSVIKIKAENQFQLIKINTDAQDVGSGTESVPANFDCEDIQIAFNVRYLLEGLKAINTEKIILSCNSPTTPAIISPSDPDIGFTYLVMPVQIRS